MTSSIDLPDWTRSQSPVLSRSVLVDKTGINLSQNYYTDVLDVSQFPSVYAATQATACPNQTNVLLRMSWMENNAKVTDQGIFLPFDSRWYSVAGNVIYTLPVRASQLKVSLERLTGSSTMNLKVVGLTNAAPAIAMSASGMSPPQGPNFQGQSFVSSSAPATIYVGPADYGVGCWFKASSAVTMTIDALLEYFPPLWGGMDPVTNPGDVYTFGQNLVSGSGMRITWTSSSAVQETVYWAVIPARP